MMILSLAVRFVLFFVFFSIAITSLAKERAGLYDFRAFVCFSRVGLCLSYSSWCQGLAVTCICSTSCTFPLIFLPVF